MVSPVAVRNYWPDAKCAKAFWSQQEVRPYRRLLADTLDWAAPASGRTMARPRLWQRAAFGRLVGAIGRAGRRGDRPRLRRRQRAGLRETPRNPRAAAGRSRPVSLPGLQSGTGRALERLVRSLQFPASRSRMPNRGRTPSECWTTEAYDRVLAEVFRVLRPRRAVRLFGRTCPNRSGGRWACCRWGTSSGPVGRCGSSSGRCG